LGGQANQRAEAPLGKMSPDDWVIIVLNEIICNLFWQLGDQRCKLEYAHSGYAKYCGRFAIGGDVLLFKDLEVPKSRQNRILTLYMPLFMT